jgi:hypothetical protein
MAYQLLGQVLSLVTSADLSTDMFCAVDVDTNGQAALPSAGGSIVGILVDKEVAGQAVSIQFGGVAQWKAGGTVAKGDHVKVDSSGRCVTASAGDVAAGASHGRVLEGATVNLNASVLLLINSDGQNSVFGFDDIVLGTTAPSALTEVTFVQTTGTKTGVLPDGKYVGQKKRFVQSVAASTPVGTVTGTFLTLAGAAATTLALGTAVAAIADFIWTGVGWRLDSAIGGTASGLS